MQRALEESFCKGWGCPGGALGVPWGSLVLRELLGCPEERPGVVLGFPAPGHPQGTRQNKPRAPPWPKASPQRTAPTLKGSFLERTIMQLRQRPLHTEPFFKEALRRGSLREEPM